MGTYWQHSLNDSLGTVRSISTTLWVNMSSKNAIQMTKETTRENIIDEKMKNKELGHTFKYNNSFMLVQEHNKTITDSKFNILKYTSMMHYFNSKGNTRPDLLMLSFGRLGNQLFHYSVNFCAALQAHRTPTLYKKSILFTLFPYLSAKKIDYYYGIAQKGKLDMKLKVGEHGHWSSFNNKLVDEIQINNKTWLAGCFQSWKYFIGCDKSIRKELIFNSRIQFDINKELHAISKDYIKDNHLRFFDITFIGVHVRRGDVTWPIHISKGYTSAPVSYIHHAIDYFNHKFHWPVFIISSEDIIWCKQNIRSKLNNVYFSPYPKIMYLHDFTLLASCNHSIITVGSFGWFAAWISGGEVIYFKDFPISGSALARGVNKSDRYPSTWIGMN